MSINAWVFLSWNSRLCVSRQPGQALCPRWEGRVFDNAVMSPFSTVIASVPAQCPFCARWPVWRMPGGICGDCLARWAHTRPRCPRCALALGQAHAPCPACAHRPSPLSHCVAAVDYAYPWHAAIAAFKYHDAPQWARAFGALLWQTPGCQDVMADVEVIFPVPLALPRLRERGYNQAWELAKVVARHAQQSHKLCFDGLTRVATGPAQAGLGKAERQSNLQVAFRVTRPHTVMGRHVLLVDDVMTTGATLFTLAGLLRQAGAREVSALVFARTALHA